jgi:hypothetical protein
MLLVSRLLPVAGHEVWHACDAIQQQGFEMANV